MGCLIEEVAFESGLESLVAFVGGHLWGGMIWTEGTAPAKAGKREGVVYVRRGLDRPLWNEEHRVEPKK